MESSNVIAISKGLEAQQLIRKWKKEKSILRKVYLKRLEELNYYYCDCCNSFERKTNKINEYEEVCDECFENSYVKCECCDKHVFIDFVSDDRGVDTCNSCKEFIS